MITPAAAALPHGSCEYWCYKHGVGKRPQSVQVKCPSTLSRFNHAVGCNVAAGIAPSVQRLATGWKVRGSNPGGNEIFRTHPDRPRGPPNFLYNRYRVCFPGVKRRARDADHPPTPSAEVEERGELYLCLESVRDWHVTGQLY